MFTGRIMKFRFLLPIISLVFSHSSITQAGDLIAGLEYQFTEEEVIETLEKSDLIISQKESKLFGRVGLNGTFQAKHPIGNLQFALYFGWENEKNDKRLNELTLRSAPITSHSWKGSISHVYMGVGKINNKLNLIISFFEKPLKAKSAGGPKKDKK